MNARQWRAELERIVFEAGDKFRFETRAERTWPEAFWAWLRGRP